MAGDGVLFIFRAAASEPKDPPSGETTSGGTVVAYHNGQPRKKISLHTVWGGWFGGTWGSKINGRTKKEGKYQPSAESD